MGGVEVVDGLHLVSGERGRLGKVIGDGVAVEQRRVVGHDERADQDGRGEAGQRVAPPQSGDAAAQQHGQPEEHHRRRPVCRAQGQAGRGVGHEGLEHAADGGGMAEGEGPDGEHHADGHQRDEVGPFPPLDQDGGDDGQDRHGVGGDEQADVLGEPHGGVGPGTEVV